MIHVCFGLRDESGKYSKLAGTAIYSLLENTHESVTIHLLHDSTLTDELRKKFTRIVYQFDQEIKFYNVDIVEAERLADLKHRFTPLKDRQQGASTFYRLFVPELLSNESKAIICDVDLIFNCDIKDLWSIDLQNYALAVAPESASGINDSNIAKRYWAPVADGSIESENYFNSGVMLMNLDNLRGGGGTPRKNFGLPVKSKTLSSLGTRCIEHFIQRQLFKATSKIQSSRGLDKKFCTN